MLAVGAVGLAVIAGYVELRVTANLKEAGIVPETKIEAMEGDIEDNTDDIDDIEDRWNRLVDALAAENN
jgi:hypothetical protein